MDKFEKAKNIISELNTIEKGTGVDGETMQYILQQTGMEWQMLRQLMLTMPIEQVKYLMEEREEHEESLNDKIDRMEGLSNMFQLKIFKESLFQLTQDWIEEGFYKEDIMEYLEHIMDKASKKK